MRHALLLILCVFAAAPVAGQGPEWGFGYQGIVFDEGDRYDLGAFTVRGGYDFRSYLGIEAEVGIGVRGGAVGYYDMAGLPPMFEDDDGWGFEAATEMDSGLAYGIGAAVRVIDRLNVRLDAGGLVVRGQHRPSLTLTLGGGF